MTCVHYWLLGEGTVNVSGRCRKCGAEREFAGGVPMSDGGPLTANGRPFNSVAVAASRKRAGEASKRAKQQEHGTNARYKGGCRCEACKAFKRAQGLDYARRMKEQAEVA